jgi:GxxExxY protein
MAALSENAVAAVVVNCAFRIHVEVGPGLLESVYEQLLAYELSRAGFQVERQKSIPIEYRGVQFSEGFRADILVEDRVLVEIKSVEVLPPVCMKQVLTYLRMSGKRLGILINFGSPRIKEGIHRIANGLPEEDGTRAIDSI